MRSLAANDTARGAIGGLVAIVGTWWLFSLLLPAGSFPVGWDPWWNLHVARTLAESGFPDAVPQAGWTQLGRDYADRQWLFHLVLAAFGGRELGPQHVPALVTGFAIALVVTVRLCARRLVGPGSVVAPTLLLWGLSSTALFRATALRDMLLALLPLLVLVTRLATATSPPRRRDHAWLFAAGLVFTLAHGAVVLPLALAVLACLGRRLDGLGFAPRLLVPLCLGIAVGAVARPNPLGSLELLWTLNVVLPWSAANGDLPLQPSEFAALPLGQLLRGSWPSFVLCGGVVWTTVRRRRGFAVALPAAALTLGALFGARLLELAVPFTVLAALQALGRCSGRAAWRIEAVGAVVAAGLAALAVVEARPSLDANRFVALADVARELRQRARPGDVVFVTDWGATSPLSFLTRDVPLRFTGVTDPVLMLREDPAAFAAWWRIRSAEDPDAAATMRRTFGARFAVVGFADHVAGRPVGETAVRIWQSAGELERSGTAVQSQDFPSPPLHRALEPGFRLYQFGR